MASFRFYFRLYLGTSPQPAPTELTDTIQRIEVTESNEGRTAFQIIFKAGRERTQADDYPLLKESWLKPFNRMIVEFRAETLQRVLVDGIITHQQLMVSNQPGGSTLTVTGEDVSVMMDLQEKIVEYPNQDESMIAKKIIGQYAKYGLKAEVTKPPVSGKPLRTERIPVQHATDLEYLQNLAARYAYVFYITPRPQGQNIAYWGPPKRKGTPQQALTVNMEGSTNVESLNLKYDALAASLISGRVQDRKSNEIKAVEIKKSTLQALSKQPALTWQPHIRQRWLRDVAGLTEADARARAQASTDASFEHVVTAEGELDFFRYGQILEARRLVNVRGVGQSYDGTYLVKQVTHMIDLEEGTYKQRFTLSREGIGALKSKV